MVGPVSILRFCGGVLCPAVFYERTEKMTTVTDLKTELINYLADIDKTKLSMDEIKTYISILAALHDMERPDPAEKMIQTMTAMQNVGFGERAKPVAMKEGT